MARRRRIPRGDRMIKLTQPLAEGARCTRRNFCVSLASLIAAPYVIRNSDVLMPVRDRTLTLVYAIKSTEGRFPEQPLGVIHPFLGKPPKGWLPFDGRTITREQHPELFKLGSLDAWRDVRLTMSGCVPALEGTSPAMRLNKWWLADAQSVFQTG